MIGYPKANRSASSRRMIYMVVVPILMIVGCASSDEHARVAAAEQHLEPLDEEILALFAEREMLYDPLHFRVFSRSGNQLIRTFVPPGLKPTSEVEGYDLDEESFRIIGVDDPEQEFIEVFMKVRKSEYGISEESPLLDVVPALAVIVGSGTCWWEWRKEGGTHVKEKVCY
jgi:hypothetical protein